MERRRIRIVDIADELGVSTATVSNVIHGKTKKISDETVKRVQELLEKRQYIPSMAGILLAQNDSKIIGVVINDHEKYEGHALEDQFISASVNALAKELERAGKFLMLKVTDQWNEIPKFASMWNMEGMVLIGYCEQDYKKLREQMHIPFVIYDGYMESSGIHVNIEVNHFDGGVQAGRYLKRMGHRDVLCISDNHICMDMERFMGLKSEIPNAELMVIPMEQKARTIFYMDHFEEIKKYSAVFAVSDYYAMDFIQFLKSAGVSVPEELSVVGFDNIRECEKFVPALTTIKQDNRQRASLAVKMLKQLRTGDCRDKNVILPVTLIERDSVRDVKMHKQ
ncbi:LacI family transcriptional regulator [Schaedlerella arabinosiphila]|uniref:LacI family transcriptional regulator n=1 Tax=Schaedlerella arabinosiphila TaxID=2044587 RepID=A0A3R8KYR6_9FIRM|nr:LacI family DNA-binding transcriptional regulator [Schaedlerella arabinosiphila]RRK31337.1 LacI family transcriptional regulator [Schaedlerella arabinosiphila]